MKYIATLIILLLPSVAAAYDKEHCRQEYRVLLDEIKRPATCWSDDDCQMVNYGCPFHPVACHYLYQSGSEKTRNADIASRIKRWRGTCMNKHGRGEPKLLYDKCVKYQAARDRCPAPPRPVCIQGVCVNMNRSMLQNREEYVISPQ